MQNIIRLENLLYSTSRRIMDRAFDRTSYKRYNVDLYDNIRSEYRRANSLRQIDNIMRMTINTAWNEAKTFLKASEQEEDEEDEEYINLILFELLYLTSYYANSASDFIIGDLNRKLMSTTDFSALQSIEASKLSMYSRTYVNDVYSTTQYYCYKKSGVEYVEFSAVIDERTSTICQMMDGTVFPIDSAEASEFRPPLHNNCRSRLVDAGTKYKDDYLYENRDFTKTKSGKELKYSDVSSNFKYINSFNNYWDLPDTVIEESLINMGLI